MPWRMSVICPRFQRSGPFDFRIGPIPACPAFAPPSFKRAKQSRSLGPDDSGPRDAGRDPCGVSRTARMARSPVPQGCRDAGPHPSHGGPTCIRLPENRRATPARPPPLPAALGRPRRPYAAGACRHCKSVRLTTIIPPKTRLSSRQALPWDIGEKGPSRPSRTSLGEKGSCV